MERYERLWGPIGKVSYILSLFLFIAALLFSGNAMLSDGLFIAFWMGILLGTECFYDIRKNISLSAAVQISSISAFITLFWLVTIWESVICGADIHLPVAVVGMLSLLISTILWIAILCGHRTRAIGSAIGSFLKQNSYVFVVVLLFCAGYIECFTFLFKSDSFTYYSTLLSNEGQWTFSLSDISKFQIAYHSTYGYSLFVFPANYLLRIYGIGVRLTNLFLTIATIFCLNDILRQLFPNKKNLFYALLLSTFAFNPLIMGLAQEMNMDMPMACFMVWFIWAFMRRKRVYSLFFAGLLCFTKENAVVMLLGFMAGIYLYRLLSTIRRHEFKISSFVTVLNPLEWTIACAPVLFVINMLIFNVWSFGVSDTASTAVEYGYAVNTFQFNLDYILIKLKQMFVFNFQWLSIPLAIWGLILRLTSSKEERHGREASAGILLSFCCYVVFHLTFFTYPHYRYLIPSAFFFTVFTGAMLSRLNSARVSHVSIAALAGAFLIQSFYSIDPITNGMSRKLPTGHGEIISESYYSEVSGHSSYIWLEKDGGDLSNECFRDYVQNNRQYLGFERCFERFLAEIDYSQDTGLIVSPIFDDDYWGADRWTATNMFGMWQREVIHWNSRLKQLTYESGDIPLRWLSMPLNRAEFEDCSDVWYVELPYKPEWDYESFMEQFETLEEREFTWGQWMFRAYRVKLADNGGRLSRESQNGDKRRMEGIAHEGNYTGRRIGNETLSSDNRHIKAAAPYL